MHQPSVTIAELWERTSQAGRTYFAAYLGRCRIALLAAGEREHKGETVKVWNLVLAEQPPQAKLRAAGSERGEEG